MKEIIISLLFVFVFSPSFAQKSKKAEKEQQVKNLIESQQYRFIAQTALPMTGKSVHLSSEYDLVVDSLNIKSYLPFFGRAYSAEYGSAEGGIKVDGKAKKYTINYNEKKKTYDINIEVEGKGDNYRFQLNAGLSGYSNLSVSSNNKQNISYYGIIEPLED